MAAVALLLIAALSGPAAPEASFTQRDGPLTSRSRIEKYEALAREAGSKGDASLQARALIEVCSYRQFEFLEWNHASCVRATEIGKRLGRPDIEAGVLTRQAAFLAWSRQFDAATKMASGALALLGPDLGQDLPVGGSARAGAHLYLGGVALEQGELGKAFSELKLGEQVARKVHDDQVLTWLVLWQGRVSFFSGQFEEAVTRYTEGLAMADRLQDPYLQASAFWFLGATAQEHSDVEAAERYNEQGIAKAASVHYDLVEAIIRINQAQIAIERGDEAAASQQVDAVERLTRGSPLLSMELVDELRGRIAALGGDHEAALQFFNRATKSKLTRPRTFTFWYAARSLAALGRLEDAKIRYLDAIASIEARRGSLPMDERRAYFLDFYLSFYRELLDLEVDTEAPVQRVFDLAEQTRARLLADRLQSAGARAETVTIQALQAALPAGTAFVEYALGDRSFQAVIVTKGAADVVSLSRGPGVDEIVERVSFVADSIGQGDPRAAFEKASRALFDQILAPLWPKLGGATVLIISPDGVFNKVPFDALILPDGRFLAETHTISLAPSASILARSLTQSSPVVNRAVAFGDPERGDGSAARSQPGTLPFAKREAEAVASLFGGSSYVGSAATLSAFRAETRLGPSLVHVATHMEVDAAAPFRTGVRFAGTGAWDGFLSAHDIPELDLSGDAVVLAGCHSASGRMMAGEGLLSVAAAFLSARARSVVGAMWDLNDSANLELMTSFYDRASSGDGVALALTMAKRKMLSRGALPRDWSGVVLWGAPDQRLPHVPWLQKHYAEAGISVGVLLLLLALTRLSLIRRSD